MIIYIIKVRVGEVVYLLHIHVVQFEAVHVVPLVEAVHVVPLVEVVHVVQ